MTDVIIGAFNDFPGFQLLLRERREEIQMSLATLDAMMKTAEGHAGKMLADPPTKNMGITSFGKLMKNLRVKALLVVDETQVANEANQFDPRNEKQVRTADAHDVVILRFTKRRMKKLAKLAAIGRTKIPKRKRVAMARRAARARWAGNRPKRKPSGDVVSY